MLCSAAEVNVPVQDQPRWSPLRLPPIAYSRARARAAPSMKLILRRRLRSALRGFRIPETYESAALDDGQERERLAALAEARRPLRLHIGCGPRVFPGWVNIDLLAYPPFAPGTREEFFAIDVTRGLPLPDGCADVVFHED